MNAFSCITGGNMKYYNMLATVETILYGKKNICIIRILLQQHLYCGRIAGDKV